MYKNFVSRLHRLYYNHVLLSYTHIISYTFFNTKKEK